MLGHIAQAPSPYTGIGLQQMTGVASRVDPAATAFAHRAEQYDFLILSQWDQPADSRANVGWTRSLFEAMEPFLEPGVYMNNLGDEGPGPGPSRLRHELRPPRRVQGEVRPRQPLPVQPQHRRRRGTAGG